MVANAILYSADAVILDLEDSVPLQSKPAARILAREALLWMDRAKTCIGVRINALDTGLAEEDIKQISVGAPDFVMLPKVESAEEVATTSELLDLAEDLAGIPRGTIRILVTVETPLGVVRAHEIATSSRRVVGIGFGAEDFRASMQLAPTEHGQELLFAKSMVAISSRAAGVAAYDTVYSNLSDDDGFLTDTERSKELGFSGKFAIHPAQVSVINSVFSPSAEEVENARKVVEAYEAALKEGVGVVRVDGKMVDEPIVMKSYKILAAAEGRREAARTDMPEKTAKRPDRPKVARIAAEAEAGVDRKGDVVIRIAPVEPGQGISVDVTSTVALLYGNAIEATVKRVLSEMGVTTDAKVSVSDRGALDFAIEARTEAAVMAASQES